MATIEESIRVLDLKPDTTSCHLYDGMKRVSMFSEEAFGKLCAPWKAGQEQRGQSRDLATERMAPIALYTRDESGKFVQSGTIKLSAINRITVYPDRAVRDERTDAVEKKGSTSSIQSIWQVSVDAELIAGGFKSVGYIQFIKRLICDQIIVKEFVPVKFQRYPGGPIEEAYIRANTDRTFQYFTTSENRVKTDPDYPPGAFNDPRLLERKTIRSSGAASY